MTKTTQKELRSLIAAGAYDLNELYKNETVRKRVYRFIRESGRKVLYSSGVNGCNGYAYLTDTGNFYVCVGNTAAMYYFD